MRRWEKSKTNPKCIQNEKSGYDNDPLLAFVKQELSNALSTCGVKRIIRPSRVDVPVTSLYISGKHVEWIRIVCKVFVEKDSEGHLVPCRNNLLEELQKCLECADPKGSKTFEEQDVWFNSCAGGRKLKYTIVLYKEI